MCLSCCCVAEEISENNRTTARYAARMYLRQQQYQQYNQPKAVYVAQPQTAVATVGMRSRSCSNSRSTKRPHRCRGEIARFRLHRLLSQAVAVQKEKKEKKDMFASTFRLRAKSRGTTALAMLREVILLGTRLPLPFCSPSRLGVHRAQRHVQRSHPRRNLETAARIDIHRDIHGKRAPLQS